LPLKKFTDWNRKLQNVTEDYGQINANTVLEGEIVMKLQYISD
jgi:hypothetical protein